MGVDEGSDKIDRPLIPLDSYTQQHCKILKFLSQKHYFKVILVSW